MNFGSGVFDLGRSRHWKRQYFFLRPNVLGNIRKIGETLEPDECLKSRHRKLHIFGKRKVCPFQICIVFHGYYVDTHLAVVRKIPNFPVCFLIRNHIDDFHLQNHIFSAMV